MRDNRRSARAVSGKQMNGKDKGRANVSYRRDSAAASGCTSQHLSHPVAASSSAEQVLRSIRRPRAFAIRCCTIVRKHLESPRREELTAEGQEAWETLRAALSYACAAAATQDGRDVLMRI